MKRILAFLLTISILAAVLPTAYAFDIDNSAVLPLEETVTPDGVILPEEDRIDLKVITGVQDVKPGAVVRIYCEYTYTGHEAKLPVLVSLYEYYSGEKLYSMAYKEYNSKTIYVNVDTTSLHAGSYYVEFAPYRVSGTSSRCYICVEGAPPVITGLKCSAVIGGRTYPSTSTDKTYNCAIGETVDFIFTTVPEEALKEYKYWIWSRYTSGMDYTRSSNHISIEPHTGGRAEVGIEVDPFGANKTLTVTLNVCTDAKGHDMRTVYTQNPTCTETGRKRQECCKCGWIDPKSTDVTPALGHDTRTVNAKAAGCETPGYTGDTVCSRCNYKVSGHTIPAVGHSFHSVNVTAPTCTAKGYTTEKCSACGKVRTTNEKPALGHQWDSGVVIVPASDNADGTMRYTCTRCKEAKDRPYHDCPANGFIDRTSDSNWAHKGIDYCIRHGIMGSVSGSRLIFEPATVLTRAQLAAILWKMEGSPNLELGTPFADVSTDAWYAKPIAWAYSSGVIAGIAQSDGTMIFDPGAPVTREMTAVMLYRYYNARSDSAPASADLSGYPDAAKVHTYAREAMGWAVGAGIISGTKNSGQIYLMPRDTATRAQTAVMIMRFCALLSD